jgi:hypothetical protein
MESLTREQARAHAKTTLAGMRADRECAVAFGRFFMKLISNKTWDTQAELSRALTVSKAHVSKAIKAARLPEAVRKVFGDDRRISYRTADVIEEIAGHIGNEKLVVHAIRLGSRVDLGVQDILAALTSGSLPEKPRKVRLAIRRGEDFIRLYTPHRLRLNKNLARFEDHVDFALKLMGYD